MTQHTPGPWDASSFQEGDLAQAYYVTNNDGRRVCLIAGYGERKRSRSPKSDDALNAEDVANARLIAAAPDLLEALRDILKMSYPAAGQVMSQQSASDIQRHREMVRDAIAKATGENLQKTT